LEEFRIKKIPAYWLAWAAVAAIIAFVSPIFQFLGYLGVIATVGVSFGLLWWYEQVKASKMWSAALTAFPDARNAYSKGDFETMWAHLPGVYLGFSVNRHYTVEECKFIAMVLEFSRKAAPETLAPGVCPDLDILEPHIKKAAAGKSGVDLSEKMRGRASISLERAKYIDCLAKGLAELSKDGGDSTKGVRLLAVALHAPTDPSDSGSIELNLEALCHIFDQCPWLLTKQELHPATRYLVQRLLEPDKTNSPYVELLDPLAEQVIELLVQKPGGIPPKPFDLSSLPKLPEMALNELVSGVPHADTIALIKKGGVHPSLAWAVTNLVADAYVPFVRKTMQRRPPATECDVCYQSIQKEKKKFYNGVWRSKNPSELNILTAFAGFGVTEIATLEGTYALCRPCYKRIRPFKKWERAARGLMGFALCLGLAFGGIALWENFRDPLSKTHLGIVFGSAAVVGFLVFFMAARRLGTDYKGYPKVEDDSFVFQELLPIR
jgi:hypothetical protein